MQFISLQDGTIIPAKALISITGIGMLNQCNTFTTSCTQLENDLFWTNNTLTRVAPEEINRLRNKAYKLLIP